MKKESPVFMVFEWIGFTDKISDSSARINNCYSGWTNESESVFKERRGLIIGVSEASEV